MIKPMLAVPMAKAIITNWHDWVAEEKYDGVRLLVEVTNRGVTAWTRRGANGKNVGGDTRDLPDHMVAAFATLPVGVYDGELVGGTTSTDVTRLELRKTLRFVVFDIVDIGAHSICSWPYEQRREYLEWLAARRPDSKGRSRGESVFKDGVIELSTAIKLTNQRDVEQFVKSVWKRGGEGAILKRKAGIYHPGKRSPDWAKVKKLQTEVMMITGFEASRGEVQDRGPHAVVLLQDDDGNLTKVKTLNDEELAKFDRAAKPGKPHPALGRKLRIEYQDRTRDGSYRHPRWDRWEDE